MNDHTTGRVLSICISEKKGTQKRPVFAARMETDHGVVGDAHAGSGMRQVSLLANESADLVRARGVRITAGDFGENILTEGIDLGRLREGDTVRIGTVTLVVTQIGKTCHRRCAIYDAAGICVMPTDGVFCAVREGGAVAPGDIIRIEPSMRANAPQTA